MGAADMSAHVDPQVSAETRAVTMDDLWALSDRKHRKAIAEECLADQLAHALREQFANPFGVGQYRVTERALAKWTAARPNYVCSCGHSVLEHPSLATGGDDWACGCEKCPCEDYDGEGLPAHIDGKEA